MLWCVLSDTLEYIFSVFVLMLSVLVSCNKKFSCTPEEDFRCFCPIEKILSHIPCTNPWER